MKFAYTKRLAACAVVLTLGMAVQAGTARAAELGIIIAPGAPPPARVETVPPPPPGPPGRVIWVNGRWNWDGHAWAWIPGHYVEPPRRHARWVEGHWRRQPGGWIWVEGHWR